MFPIRKLRVVSGKLWIEITTFLGNCESTFFDDQIFFLSELLYLLCSLLYCAYELYILERKIIKTKLWTQSIAKNFFQQFFSVFHISVSTILFTKLEKIKRWKR